VRCMGGGETSWAVIDIDGVLADVRHRVHHVTSSPKNWDEFFAAAPCDPPLPQGLARVRELVDSQHRIVYVSGRPERCRADTVTWLRDNAFPEAPLHLRSDHDRRPARLTKLAIIRQLERVAPVAMIVDDDSAVVATLREAGYTVEHATWMDGGTNGVDHSPVQEALFEAQELDGRT